MPSDSPVCSSASGDCRNCDPDAPIRRFWAGFGPARFWLCQPVVQTVKQLAVDSAIGVIGHPFAPYVIILIALLQNL